MKLILNFDIFLLNYSYNINFVRSRNVYLVKIQNFSLKSFFFFSIRSIFNEIQSKELIFLFNFVTTDRHMDSFEGSEKVALVY